MTPNQAISMKAKVAAIAVIGLLTLSVFAIGFTALGEAENSAAASSVTPATEPGDNAAVSAFKFVCPFH